LQEDTKPRATDILEFRKIQNEMIIVLIDCRKKLLFEFSGSAGIQPTLDRKYINMVDLISLDNHGLPFTYL